jgi:putative ABC transport system permease protein
MRRQGLEKEAIPQMFEPLAQSPSRLATLLVRTSIEDPMKMLPSLEAAVHRVDKHVPVYGATTLENRLDAFLTERRFQTSLLTGFSAVAVLMAAIGIYGLIQYSIATRTREIGIRMAIGATESDVQRQFLIEAVVLSLIGGFVGIVFGAGASYLITSMLDWAVMISPVAIFTAVVFSMGVGIFFGFYPARKAARLDPIEALRYE